MRPDRVIVEHQSQLANLFSLWFAERVEDAIRQRGRASIALPGGSVADVFLPGLLELNLDWSRLHWFWGDERAVPPDSPDSNHAQARRLLFDHAPPTHIHRIPTELSPLATAAQDYQTTLLNRLGRTPCLDIALLGIGADGHVCSLFPGLPTLQSQDWVTAVQNAPKPPPERITLTLRCLAAARSLVLAAFGSGKARIVSEILSRDNQELPAARVLFNARHSPDQQSLCFIDSEAASELDESGKA